MNRFGGLDLGEEAMHYMRCAACSSGYVCSRLTEIRARKSSPLFMLCSSTTLTLEALTKALNETTANQKNNKGQIPLHQLVQNPNSTLEMVKYYVENFKGLDRVDSVGKNALSYTTKVGREAIVEYILTRHPASGSLFAKDNQCAFDIACYSSSVALLELFLKHCSEKELERCKGFEYLVSNSSVGTLKVVNEKFPTILKKTVQSPFMKLFDIRHEGQLEKFDYLVEHVIPTARVKRLLSQPKTLQRFFCQAVDEHKHDLLVAKIIDIVGKDIFDLDLGKGMNPLHTLCNSWTYSNIRTVNMYFKKCKELKVSQKHVAMQKTKRTEETALHLILKNSSLFHCSTSSGVNYLKNLLSYSNEVINMKDREGKNCLQRLCYVRTRNISFEPYEILIKNGKENIIKTLSKEEEEYLRSTGQMEVIKLLVSHGANFNIHYFLDKKRSYETKITEESMKVEAKYGYSCAISVNGYRTEYIEKLIKIEKLIPGKDCFFGCSTREYPLNVYLGNRRGGYAVRSNGSVFNNGKGKNKQFRPMKQGDYVTVVLDAKKKDFHVRVNGKPLMKIGKKEKLLKNPVFRKMKLKGEIYLCFGLFKGVVLRFVEEWSTKLHKHFPQTFKKMIMMLLMLNNNPESEFSKIPKDVLIYVLFKYLPP